MRLRSVMPLSVNGLKRSGTGSFHQSGFWVSFIAEASRGRDSHGSASSGLMFQEVGGLGVGCGLLGMVQCQLCNLPSHALGNHADLHPIPVGRAACVSQPIFDPTGIDPVWWTP